MRAHSRVQLLERLEAWSPGEPSGPIVHAQTSERYERHARVGGTLAVVQADIEQAAPQDYRRLQADLMATYRDDFAKYVGRMDPHLLDLVLVSVAAQLGGLFVYAKVSEGLNHAQAKHLLQWLAMSRLVTLASNLRGRLAQQLDGQQLRILTPGSGDEPTLHYWQRGAWRPDEIDYLVEIDQTPLPVELKAGASGSMKSLHRFMHDKRLEFAIRVDTNPPSAMDVDVRTTQGDRSHYKLLSLPGYLLWRARELAGSALDRVPGIE